MAIWRNIGCAAVIIASKCDVDGVNELKVFRKSSFIPIWQLHHKKKCNVNKWEDRSFIKKNFNKKQRALKAI